MAKNPENEQGFAVNPDIDVSAPVGRIYSETTAGQQTPEKRYAEALSRVVNKSPTTTQRK